MAKRSSYAPGTPCWVELGTADAAESAGFYGALFGWQRAPADPGWRAARNGLFTRDGKRIAGLKALRDAARPAAWITYVSVEDAHAAAARVTAAGGRVVSEPLEVADAGRTATFSDPEGAVFAVWQPLGRGGAELVNEPGTLSWNELNTRDPVAAKAFYAAVFGWDPQTERIGADGPPYIRWMLDGNAVGGMIDIRGRAPDEVAPHWMTYFAVEACGAVVKKAAGLGAQALVGPVELPHGYFAVLRDPQGAHFAVFEGPAGPA